MFGHIVYHKYTWSIATNWINRLESTRLICEWITLSLVLIFDFDAYNLAREWRRNEFFGSLERYSLIALIMFSILYKPCEDGHSVIVLNSPSWSSLTIENCKIKNFGSYSIESEWVNEWMNEWMNQRINKSMNEW
jgi:hypothetical protein